MFTIKSSLNLYKYKRKVVQITFRKFCDTSEKKLKILFFGTDNFSLPSLQKLHKSSSTSSLSVVTSFKSPANPVKCYAEKESLTLHSWPLKDTEVYQHDLGVVVSFGHLIPEKIISSFPLGMINVHASLLPKWRGAAPIVYSIMSGDTKTGVSIMRIEPKHFDIGDILAQDVVEISPNMLMPELHRELSLKGADLLLKTIQSYPSSFKESVKQESSLVTYAPKVTPSLTEISWNTQSSKQVYDLFRSLFSYKELTTRFKKLSVKIVELRLIEKTESTVRTTESSNQTVNPPGTVEYVKSKKALRVFCADGGFVEVTKLKVDGKKVMSAGDFNNGFLKKCSQDEKVFSNCGEVKSC
ncbi:MTFMT family protein [Megaselia abdita]